MNILSSSEFVLAFLIGCSVKATLLLALTAGTAYALRRRSAAARHHVWALGIVSAMALLLLTVLLPSWHSAWSRRVARLWGGALVMAKKAPPTRVRPVTPMAAAVGLFWGQFA